jgi:hypothetical protein
LEKKGITVRNNFRVEFINDSKLILVLTCEFMILLEVFLSNSNSQERFDCPDLKSTFPA